MLSISKIPRSKKFWLIFCFLLTFLVGIYDINASGETTDEWYHFLMSWKQYLNVRKLDFSEEAWKLEIEHPPVYRYFYGLPANLTLKYKPQDPSYTLHNQTYTRIISVFLASLTSVIVLLVGWEFFEPRVGILASLVFFFQPAILAYARITGKDAATWLFFTLTSYLFFKALKEERGRLYLLTGISFGLALATRYNNIFLLVIILGLMLLKHKQEVIKTRKITLPLSLLLIPLLAGVVFFAVWPWLWHSPLERLIDSFNHWSKMAEGYTKMQPLYHIEYFLIKTPALLLALWLTAFLRVRNKNHTLWEKGLILWFFSPFLMFLGKYKIDGIKHVLNFAPALSLLAAISLFSFSDWLSRKIKLSKEVLAVFAGTALLLYLGFSDMLFHPYQLNYYNELIGGPKNAAKKGFLVGYWGESVKEVVDYLNRTASTNATLQLAVAPEHVVPPLREDLKQIPHIIPRHFWNVVDPEVSPFYRGIPEEGERADYLLVYNVEVIPEPEKYYRLEYASEVLGQPLTRLYRRR